MSSTKKRPFAVLASGTKTKTFNLLNNAICEAQLLAKQTGKDVLIHNSGQHERIVKVRPKDAAYHRGIAAVRLLPRYAPDNPYDEESQKAEYDAWDDGAYDAGICQIYNNGELIERFRR